MADRTESGPTRTPRSQITRTVPEGTDRELVILVELTGVMETPARPGGPEWSPQHSRGGRRGIVVNALGNLAAALEDKSGQRPGDPDFKGGIPAIGFANGATDLGLLNTANVDNVLSTIQWGGHQRRLMPAYERAVQDYEARYGDRPADQRPVLQFLVLTAGQPADWDIFSPVLETATSKRVFDIAIIGHGNDQEAALHAYQDAADRNRVVDPTGDSHVTVISFDEADPDDISDDLITMIGV